MIYYPDPLCSLFVDRLIPLLIQNILFLLNGHGRNFNLISIGFDLFPRPISIPYASSVFLTRLNSEKESLGSRDA
jgi:hypothetical protein